MGVIRTRAATLGTTNVTHAANGTMLTGLGRKIIPHAGENRPLSVTHLGKRTCYVYGVEGPSA